jgi:hypothetical protein
MTEAGGASYSWVGIDAAIDAAGAAVDGDATQ